MKKYRRQFWTTLGLIATLNGLGLAYADLSWDEIVEKYHIKEALRNFEKERRHLARGQMIIVDTRDERACREVYETLLRLPDLGNPAPTYENLCARNADKPIVSVTLFQDLPEYAVPINLDPLRSTDRSLVNETRNLAYSMGITMGILWMMPESVTKWDKASVRDGRRDLLSQYAEHVRKGPVMDHDKWSVNYIGHPIAGAAYYTLARHTGLSQWESFGYSVAMSTFFWEYGFEAFAEIPSIQDLIVTPIIGSLLGEVFYSVEQQIRENGGTLWGSEKLGQTALVLLNPMGSLSSGINRALGTRFIQDAEAEFVSARRAPGTEGLPPLPGSSNYFGIRLKFKF